MGLATNPGTIVWRGLCSLEDADACAITKLRKGLRKVRDIQHEYNILWKTGEIFFTYPYGGGLGCVEEDAALNRHQLSSEVANSSIMSAVFIRAITYDDKPDPCDVKGLLATILIREPRQEVRGD